MSSNLEKMLAARLYVIDKFCPPNDKDKQLLRNKALAKIFKDRGDGFLMQKDYIKARQEYHKAIKHDPLAFWPRVNLIKTVLTNK